MGEKSVSRSGRAIVTMDELRSSIGAPPTASDWVTVDQAMIDRFAEATRDDAFIHVDPVAAARTRFGGTIAHGLLLLSLTPWLMRSATPLISGTKMGANYGYEKVRFPASLPVNTRARCWFALAAIEERGPGSFTLHYDVSIEGEGVAKPVLVGRWLIARWMGDETA